jgi:hypothetical protein
MRPHCKTINVTDLRAGMREIIENAHFRGQHYVVERAGQPMVVILNVDEYERLLANWQADGAAPFANGTSLLPGVEAPHSR